jgi:Copper amine oxidase N-terminal domain
LKRFFVATFAAAAFVVTCIAPSFADASPTPTMSGTTATPMPMMQPTLPPMDFGSPPSGEVPILFNDHHVYANPDTLREGRVLAALVKDGTLMVPVRSMFEQMGATVSYDASAKSVTASKPGSEVEVTLGKAEVVINGESRPLDVPPVMYKGVLLVPIRVISEALGAYVQWVPDQHLAVVRYTPPTPVPTPPPTPVPTPVATPVPAPTIPSYHFYIEGGYALANVWNEYSSGGSGNSTKGANYVASGALLLDKLALKIDWRQDQYTTASNTAVGNNLFAPFTTFNTIDGGAATVPVFLARQSTLDGRLEYQLAPPHIYIGLGYLQASNNYGNPSLTGPGAGLEKLPDFTGGLGWFGSFFYYPNTRGQYTVPAGPHAGLKLTTAYQIYKYDLGLNYEFGRSPFYTYAGFSGDKYTHRQASPADETHAGPYLGFGLKF